MSKAPKMPDKYMPLSFDTFELYKNDFIKYHIPVLRLNSEERFIVFPIKNMDYFLGDDDVREKNIDKLKLYVQKDFKNILEQEDKKYNVISEKQIKIASMQMSRSGVISKMNELPSIEIDAQDRRISECMSSMNKAMRVHGANTQETTWAYLNCMLDIVSILVFRFQNNEYSEDSTDRVIYKNLNMPKGFSLFIKSLSQYFLKKNPYPNIFESLSYYIDNTIVSRILRVFTIYTDFLYFYNKIFAESLAPKIRQSFVKDYTNYYKRLMFPYNREDKFIKLEDAVDRSMRSLTQRELLNCSIAGFLETVIFYNQGDISSLEVKELMSKYNYSEDTALTVSLSHDFYDYKKSIYYEKYMKRVTTLSNDKIQFAFTYDFPTIAATNALAYFPAKALEIVSLYDRLLYPDIIPEDEYMILSPEQAICIIKEDYLEDVVKVDPIVFDIFVDYINGQLL